MSNPAGKSAAARTFQKKKSTNPSDRIENRQQTSVSLASEAKVDAGKSPEEKEKVRNKRKFGVSHNVAGHGKLRRALHRSNRGDKKIPGDKPYFEKEGVDYSPCKTCGSKDHTTKQHDKMVIDEKFKTQYNKPDKLSQSSQRKSLGRGASIKDGAKKSGYESKKEHRDTSKKLAKYQAKGSYNAHLGEEGYDHMRDKRLEKYGIGHDGSDRKSTPSRSKPQTDAERKKSQANSKKAFDSVVASLKKKYGDNAVMTSSRTKKGGKSVKEETLNEISADKLLDASKAADKDRGKKAVAGDKEGAKKRVRQASKFYVASAKKRKQEAKEGYKPDPVEKRKSKAADLHRRETIASNTPKKYKTDKTEDPDKLYKRRMAVDSKTKIKKEEYTVTNADKKGNTPAWKAYKAGKKHAKTGKPLYKAADHVKEGQWEYHEKEGLKTFSEFIQEGNPTTRMMSKSKTQTTGNISADRGTDAKKNRESRKGLEKDLKKKGIGYKKGTGEYKYDDGSKGREVSYQTTPAKGMSKRRFGKTMRRLGRKHGQESVITKKAGKPARLHDTESKKPGKSTTLGKTKPGKHPKGYGETSGTKVRDKKLSKKTNKPSYHYG